MEGGKGGGGFSVEGGRQLHLSFVSFQQERERERSFSEVEAILAAERGSARGKGGRAVRKEKRGARRAVCLDPVGFPSVRFPVLLSRPCGRDRHCVPVSLCARS